MGQNSKYIFVDIGYKDYVMIDATEKEISVLNRLEKNKDDKIEVMITDFRENPYQIVGSFLSIDKKYAYEDILENSDTDVLIAKIQEWSPAGYKLEIFYDDFKIPAFMPNTLAGINKLSDPQSIVGKELEVMIESFSDEKGTFIASRKKYMQTLIPKALDEIRIIDENGDPVLYTGSVTGTTKFGIFVEFNNEILTGMIHKDNFAPDMILEHIKPGNSINFYIKENIKGKLILTQVWRKTLWDTIAINDTFDVSIRDIKTIGALVALDNETTGLISNFELKKGKKQYKIGDNIQVKVNTVQRGERKIFLTIM